MLETLKLKTDSFHQVKDAEISVWDTGCAINGCRIYTIDKGFKSYILVAGKL